ncbi:hypothetical protein N7454_007203 [Penicillium verhagenii]|nr:hypothetical protein N7454_007203 [Penicillium verhagenii]
MGDTEWTQSTQNMEQAMEEAYLSASDTMTLIHVVQDLTTETKKSLEEIAAQKAELEALKADLDKAERLFIEANVTLDVLAHQLCEGELSRDYTNIMFIRARRIIEGAFALILPKAGFTARVPFLMRHGPEQCSSKVAK